MRTDRHLGEPRLRAVQPDRYHPGVKCNDSADRERLGSVPLADPQTEQIEQYFLSYSE
jgi:hypothetical protein